MWEDLVLRECQAKKYSDDEIVDTFGRSRTKDSPVVKEDTEHARSESTKTLAMLWSPTGSAASKLISTRNKTFQ